MSTAKTRFSIWMLTAACLLLLFGTVSAEQAGRTAPGQHDSGDGAAPAILAPVDADGDGVPLPADCADNNAAIYPAHLRCDQGVNDGKYCTGAGDCPGGTCSISVPAPPERCNSVDDDCDALADENFPELDDPCTVGVGACENSGVFQCPAGGMATTTECSVAPFAPTAEVCGNSIDDDCDGNTDNAGMPEVCGDLIDNDCDGVTDGGDRYVEVAGSDAANDCTDSGSPCASIQHAIDEACDGDTVRVGAGTFSEDVAVNHLVTVVGQGIGTTIVDVSGQSGQNNAGMWVSADGVTLRDFTLSGNYSNPPRYGIKVSHPGFARLDSVTLERLRVENIFRTGFDLNGPSNLVMTDCQAVDNHGAGVFLLDADGAAISGLTTSGNSWAGISVATYGRYAPLGTTGVVFTGSNSFGEVAVANGGLQLEEGNFNNPGNPEPITWSSCPGDGADVTIQPADFLFALGGPQDDVNPRTRFYASLAQAQSAAAGSPDHFLAQDRFIQDADCFGTTPTHFHVFDDAGDKMSIQAAIDAADADDVVHVADGGFPGGVDIDKALTISCNNAGVPYSGFRAPESVIDGSGEREVVSLTVSDVIIDGCELVGDAGTTAGVQMFNGSSSINGVSVVNNKIHGMARDNEFSIFDYAYGIFGVTGSPGARQQITDLTVTGNEIYAIGGGGSSGGGIYLFNVIGGAPGDGATITGNSFHGMATGSATAPHVEAGTGVVILEGADDGGGVPTAPSSGVLVQGNVYSDMTLGAALLADFSTFDEPHANFDLTDPTDVTAFMLNISTLTTVGEAILEPYAKSDLPTNFPGSELYTPTIQAAVDLSDATATIDVTTGTFVEQVDIPKTVQVIGSGAAFTTIQAPATLAADINGQRTIVTVRGAGVNTEISDLTVAGPGPSGCGSLHYGIFVRDGANANIHDNVIRDIRDEPLSGCQNGGGIRVGAQFWPTVGTATITSNQIYAYQKGGIVVDGIGSSAIVTGNAVTGVGATPAIAQNGIQVSRGAVGTLSLNTVQDNQCDHASCGNDPFADYGSIGVLLFDSGSPVLIDDNIIQANDLGIYNFGAGATASNNDVLNNRYQGVMADEGSITVEDNTLSGNGLSGVTVITFGGFATGDSVATVLRNTITGSGAGLQVLDDDDVDGYDPVLTANFNHISANGIGAERPPAYFGDAGKTDDDVTCNWWGDPSGPGPVGPGSGDTITAGLDAASWLLAADFGADTDGDTFGSCNDPLLAGQGDCVPGEETVYPGAPQICDGLNNDCAAVGWPAVPVDEVDDDGDLQAECEGDCDDTRDFIYTGATERCDDTVSPGTQFDRDCDGVLETAGAQPDSDCASGNTCQADFCDTDDTCAFVSSGSCEVAGTVYYNQAPGGVDGFDFGKLVESAVLDLAGDTPGTENSDAAGEYQFVSVAGDLTLTASKDLDLGGNDLSAVTGQDAAAIAQYSVGSLSLSPRQRVAGDVSNNGSVTSFDAALVSQKAVNPGFLFPVATANGSDWVFFDLPLTYTPIAMDTLGVDLAGIVYGDVTLNWTPTAKSAVAGSESQPEPKAAEVSDIDLSPRQEAALLYLAAVRPLRDGTVEYVLGLADADGIRSIDLKLRYPRGLTLVSTEALDLVSGFQTVSHDQGHGRAATAMYGLQPLIGTGEFLSLIVRSDGPATGAFPLGLEIEANEGLIPVVLSPELVAPVRQQPEPQDDNQNNDGGVQDIEFTGNRPVGQ